MQTPLTQSPAELILTDEQEQPVSRRSEPLLLSAAAGSGKTSVLVERFVRAIREDGIAPGKILAITFTDRAAGELRERGEVRELLDEALAMAGEAAAEAGRGAIEARPQTCMFGKGGCEFPTICRCER